MLPVSRILGSLNAGSLLRGTAQNHGAPSGLLRGPDLCVLARDMNSPVKTDHLQRTANTSRQQAIFPAKVVGMWDETDTVKRLRLAVPHSDFTFKAGQWVDFFIPGVETVGGFSICSSPGLLKKEGIIELAVKCNRHPPAHWIHTECAVDSQVKVRVGGDFYYPPQTCDGPVHVLLVAGGVGINPLYSILLHTSELLQEGKGHRPSSVHLCYSARNTHQLLFTDSILSVCGRSSGLITCDFHLTRQRGPVEPRLRPLVREGRLSEQLLREHLTGAQTLCYLCGPPPMIQSASAVLQTLGLPAHRILYEKWW